MLAVLAYDLPFFVFACLCRRRATDDATHIFYIYYVLNIHLTLIIILL